MPSAPMNHIPALRRALSQWFEAEARDLPWRKTQDPYLIWISEIMLQQTRVDQGLPYYHRFTKAFPALKDLADAPLDAVLKQWEGLGYYTRARNLHKAARHVMREYNGELPRQAELLQLLPGIGPYTAGAIASIAFGENVPVVDGNVSRVIARLFNIETSLEEAVTTKRLWELAATLLPRREPGAFNEAMMELGARVCTPRNPSCLECPFSSHCVALAKRVQEQRPVRKKKKAVPHHEIVVAAISRDGAYLIAKRPPEGLLGGLWEFPGGKVGPGERHQQALERECLEELGIAVKVGGLVATVKHAYTHFKVTLNVYKCVVSKGTPKAKLHSELRWASPQEFESFAFPKANHKFLALL